MGMREPFLYQLVPAVAEAMKGCYPELKETIARVQDVIRREENDFFQTIDAGLNRIESVFDSMSSKQRVMVDGREAASLYQTYGVPPELFQTLAAERNLTFDWDGYRAAMHEHETISGGDQRELFQTGPIETLKEALLRTDFLGYETTESPAEVKGIIVGSPEDDRLVGHLLAGGDPNQTIRVVLDRSPFYAEGGGQVGDGGEIVSGDTRFEVQDTKRVGELIVHYGQLTSGELKEGQSVTARVNKDRRNAIARAHSATHILHHALQRLVGGHAQQQGSKVDADWLRFDFTNQAALTDDQVDEIEKIVNERVREAAPVSWKLVPLGEARKAGAMMLFGEKYPDPVRMVSMGEFSRELCGGTHLTNTKEVEEFEVIAEESVSAGTRRVVALTGARAAEHRKQVEQILVDAAKVLATTPAQLPDQTRGLVKRVRDLKKQLVGGGGGASEGAVAVTSAVSKLTGYALQRASLRDVARLLNVAPQEISTRLKALQEELARLTEQATRLAGTGDVSAGSLMDQAVKVGDTSVIVVETSGATPNLMRQWIDQIRKQSASPVAVLLASREGDDKVLLVAGISRALVDQGMSAGTWISRVAPVVGGGGGGKPDLAQAGGKQPEKLPEAIQTAKDAMREMLEKASGA